MEEILQTPVSHFECKIEAYPLIRTHCLDLVSPRSSVVFGYGYKNIAYLVSYVLCTKCREAGRVLRNLCYHTDLVITKMNLFYL